jgi:hypothetical protein
MKKWIFLLSLILENNVLLKVLQFPFENSLTLQQMLNTSLP